VKASKKILFTEYVSILPSDKWREQYNCGKAKEPPSIY